MLQNLLEQLRNAGTGSKTIAALVFVAVIAIGATAAVVANKPHFELLYSELSASENAAVQKALASAGIPFDQSQPPGPYIIYVDRGKKYEAMHAVAIAGALDKMPGGVVSSQSGMTSVFMNQEEREQATNKRNLEEMEKMLEVFDFVITAKVNTSVAAHRPFGGEARKTGSVMLTLRKSDPITKAQKQNVASMVQSGLGIEPGDLMISDQEGNTIYDGSKFNESDGGGGDWLENKRMYERDLEERANSTLAAILGENKARVTVVSSWKRDMATTVAETSDPDGTVVISETTASTKTPKGTTPPVGGAAGSNVGEFSADDGSAAEAGSAAGGTEQVAKSDDKTRQFWAPKETKRTVSLAPVLTHLSVSLYLDESLADRRDDLEANVKATVGFLSDRNGKSDTFSAIVTPFVSLEGEVAEGEEGAEGAEGAAAPEEEPAEMSPMMTMLLERGVEILAAVAFLFILMRSLKAPPKTAEVSAEEAVVEAIAEDDGMLERLAQTQIDELVKSDPERVGQILSAWAGDQKATAGS